MVPQELLNCIWSGEIRVCEQEERSPLAALLNSLLNVPTVTLVAASGLTQPIAFADCVELAPGLLLGDVLSEELQVEVPVNSVILLEPAEYAAALSFSTKELGQNLGNVLSSFASVGVLDRQLPWPKPSNDRTSVELRGFV